MSLSKNNDLKYEEYHFEDKKLFDMESIIKYNYSLPLLKINFSEYNWKIKLNI